MYYDGCFGKKELPEEIFIYNERTLYYLMRILKHLLYKALLFC